MNEAAKPEAKMESGAKVSRKWWWIAGVVAIVAVVWLGNTLIEAKREVEATTKAKHAIQVAQNNLDCWGISISKLWL